MCVNELPDLLTTWLPQQRWFAAKGRPVGSVEIAARTPLMTDGEPLVDHLLLAVSFTDGSPVQHYQLWLGRREHPRADLEHVVIGSVDGALAYDALWDVEVTAWLLETLRAGGTVGGIAFVPEPGAEIAQGVAGRVLGIEQSNTSVSWGERSILKVFRRVVPGLNPDLELHRALRSVDSNEVAALQGAIEGTVDGAPATLGMLQDFAANSADGWSMALASVRDLLAEGDLRADEVGGDFAAEASRLGETVGVVHDELRRALGTGERDAREIAAVWHQRLAVTTAEVPALAPHVDAIRATYDAVAGLGAPLPAQRVHGDLHLGQTLRTPYGWLVIDFEGEPAAPLEERVRPDSCLRDVAGMLRSFDYAAFHQILQWEPGTFADPDHDSQLVWRANEWAERNRGAFCDGYALRAGSDPRDQRMLLRAFELDKAVYELLYETRSRPAWAPIPLASIARLTSEETVR
ncbi:aminoglycoside phosphotransferase [Pseudonocardia sp. KRD-184]|uniref:Aminoglycoside phosphotransferase n=1 Tax=Pseudonocardia oceani TaxID=2792013 RepID=A0ABS6U6P8_9PSEU|nr:aminoglycoside phosphotransferase [Pseudonocardia oceani]MBW0098975.1 aminoglycoside phosphotransferase [Pseudonocardia oceani]MBW0122820.1 aminoglycoside phosphotransferase [Pseudonocardia oceani]MBW0127574.1 aminoglycoside phosphotransferase [Pseudonocardia oceani]